MLRTTRDHDILEVLTFKVRLLTLPQIAGTWWGGSDSALTRARARLAELQHAGLIKALQVHTDKMLPLDTPVATWAPGEPDPQYGAVAYELQHRWSQDAPRLTRVYVATRKAANQYGGVGGRLKFPDQATHDLHLSELYLRFRQSNRDLANRWINEDLRPKAGFKQKDPDILIQDDAHSGLAIEFGGRYDARRIRDFHRDCAARERRWQIW